MPAWKETGSAIADITPVTYCGHYVGLPSIITLDEQATYDFEYGMSGAVSVVGGRWVRGDSDLVEDLSHTESKGSDGSSSRRNSNAWCPVDIPVM